MSDVIIECEKLGKHYTIGSAGPRERYTALRDVLASQARTLVRRARHGLRWPAAGGRARDEAFWALRDVSFEIKRGEAVGIIGRNGAGKSTLLKVLSRITEPSAGRVTLRGRVASLLEVGTGFHPELTGRENIYLNGAILGMSRAEIRRKFDEIVAFAEVEKFLDTPVKRYSSGMYVRLAFAVAAHLDPEILVVDEVLAVGDAAFQKKCLGKMKDVASHGRTVLFVSHNMAAVRRLCGRGLVLERGSVVKSGGVAEAVSFYLESGDGTPSLRRCWPEDTAPRNENIRLLEVAVDALTGDEIDTDSGFQVSWTFRSLRQHTDLGTTMEIRNQDDTAVIHDGVRVSPGCPCAPAVYQARMTVPPMLNAGRYRIDLMFGEQQRYLLLRLDHVLNFEVVYRPSAERLSPPPGVLKTCLDGNVQIVGN